MDALLADPSHASRVLGAPPAAAGAHSAHGAAAAGGHSAADRAVAWNREHDGDTKVVRCRMNPD